HTPSDSTIHSSAISPLLPSLLFFFTDTAPSQIYTLSLHDALPISLLGDSLGRLLRYAGHPVQREYYVNDIGKQMVLLYWAVTNRSEEHTSELQSLAYLVCRLLLEKKKKYNN